MASPKGFKDAARYRVLQTFKEWDSDGSGCISADELEFALTKLGLSADKSAELVKNIDLNKDGSISYMEFTSWVFGKAVTDLPDGAEKTLWQKEACKDVFKAARRGQVDVMSSMMQRDGLVTVDSRDEQGCTLLIAAAQKGNLDVVKRLLEMKCSALNASDHDGCTALDHARVNGNARLLEYMLHQHTSNDNGNVPFVGSLLQAMDREDAEAVRQSVRPRVVFKIYIDRHEGDMMGIQTKPCGTAELVVTGVSPGLVETWNMKNSSLQVRPGDHLVKVNETSGDFNLVKKELLKFQEMTITLHRYSFGEGFDPNTRDEYGNPALHLAVRSGKLALVEALATSPDLKVNEKDRYERTALDIAHEKNFEDIVRFLQKRFAQKANEMRTPTSGDAKRISLEHGQ